MKSDKIPFTMKKAHYFDNLQGLWRSSGAMLAACVLVIYLVPRLLLGDAGISAYFLLSFCLSLFFFSFINHVYGFLPRYEAAPTNRDWRMWLRYGYGGNEKAVFGSRSFYLIAIALILIDISAISGIIENKSIFSPLEIYVGCVLAFLLLGLSVRGNVGSFSHWLKHEIYWIKAAYACLLFLVATVSLLLMTDENYIFMRTVSLIIIFPLSFLCYNLFSQLKKGRDSDGL